MATNPEELLSLCTRMYYRALDRAEAVVLTSLEGSSQLIETRLASMSYLRQYAIRR